MATTVKRYQVRTPGHDPNIARASISLLGDGSVNTLVARVHFVDAGVQLPADSEREGVIDMYLPLAAFAGIVAMLQHDSPIKLDFQAGRGQLWTGEWEQVGETEQLRK